jgi:N6-adenosine-specific RNA methylase IME4
MNELAKVEKFRYQVAIAQTLEDCEKLEKAGEAIALLMRRSDFSKEKQDDFGIIRIELEEKKGELLDEQYPHGGDKPSKKDKKFEGTKQEPSKMPVTRKESSRARTIKRTDKNELKNVIDEIRKSRRVVAPSIVAMQLKKKQKIKQNTELQNKIIKSINGLYDVVVIDPPWDMKKIVRECAPDQIEFDYPTMSIDEIKNFTIPAEDNCHLFLWTTQKYLPHSFDVLNAWNFKYVLTFVWHKNGGFQPFNLPQYNCEFCVYARKGTPEFIDTKDFFTCFSADRTGHSKKPDEFYKTIERVTAGSRIDIFSRRNMPGFVAWGNEANE